MPRDSCRKRCVECKRTMGGTIGKAQWCERCGGEMRAIPYARPKRKVKR